MDDLLESATLLAGAGVMIARSWGVRLSHPRGLICACNSDAEFCRVGRPGAHALHFDPGRSATRDPDVLAGWRTAFQGENLLALPGARSRLAALEFANPEALQAALRHYGPLPVTPTSRAPDGALTAWFRWAKPPVIAPDALGVDIRAHGEASRVLVPGSMLIDGAVRWAVSPDTTHLAGLPVSWRQAILDAPRCRVFRAA